MDGPYVPLKYANTYLVMFNHFSVTCPTSSPNYVSISGSCYYIEDTKMTYADAQLNCHSKFGGSGILFEPRDVNTNKLVNTAAATLTSSAFHWFGINDFSIQGQYVYASDGQDVVNVMWHPGQPNDANHRCVYGYFSTSAGSFGNLVDNACDLELYSICQAQNTGKEGTLKHL